MFFLCILIYSIALPLILIHGNKNISTVKWILTPLQNKSYSVFFDKLNCHLVTVNTQFQSVMLQLHFTASQQSLCVVLSILYSMFDAYASAMFTIRLFVLIVKLSCEVHIIFSALICVSDLLFFFQVKERKALRQNSVWQIVVSEGIVPSLTPPLN